MCSSPLKLNIRRLGIFPFQIYGDIQWTRNRITNALQFTMIVMIPLFVYSLPVCSFQVSKAFCPWKLEECYFDTHISVLKNKIHTSFLNDVSFLFHFLNPWETNCISSIQQETQHSNQASNDFYALICLYNPYRYKIIYNYSFCYHFDFLRFRKSVFYTYQ